MKITKDEATLLAAIVNEGKYDFNNSLRANTKQEALASIGMINKLQEKLEKDGFDERRTGRTTQNSVHDLVKRLIKKYEKVQKKDQY